MQSKKVVIGLVESVEINGKEIRAKIDTGSDRSSIDANLAVELKLGPILAIKECKSSHGKTKRPVVEAEIMLKNRRFKINFSIIDRTDLKYSVLVGKDVLKKGFLIDPSRE